MAAQYSVDELDLEAQRPDIVSLWVANLSHGSTTAAQAKVDNGYVHNPAGRGIAFGLYTQDRTAVGVICMHPRTIFHQGETLRAANVADYAVDAAHRTLGPALMLMKGAMGLGQERFDLVYGLPNAKATAICARAGMRRLGGMKRHARILSSRRLLESRVPAWLLAPLAAAADVGIRVAEGLAGLHQGPRLNCRAAAFDDAAVDTIWRARPRDLYLSDRSSAFMAWRYGRPGRDTWRMCIASNAAGQPIGMVVWRLRKEVADVGDFFAADPRQDTRALMNAFSIYARAQGAAAVTVLFYGCAEVAAALRRASFRMWAEHGPVFVGTKLAPERLAELPSHWYLTAFDNDDD